MKTLISIIFIYTIIGWIKFIYLKQKDDIYENILFITSFVLCNITILVIIIGLIIKYLP